MIATRFHLPRRLARMGAVAAAAVSALVAQAPAHAWVQNAHFWVSVGVFSRFNVVTRDDFSANHSDMECGFAAGRDAHLNGGYTIGRSGVVAVGDTTRKQIGALISRDLYWSNPSGSVDGDVYIGEDTNVTIAAESTVTLRPGNTVRPITGSTLFNAITAELWVGWGADTVNWGYGSLTPNNSAPGATGWTGHTNTPLNGVFQAFFDQYLANMTGGILMTAANGLTQVDYFGTPRNNITLDGRNLGRYDMPGNRLSNGQPNTNQPGGRRAVYIFDINATDLSRADQVQIRNVRNTDEFGSPTWTVIKVKANNGATSATMAEMGLGDFAPRNNRTIWVFEPAITTININAVGIEGTILAPRAHVNANNANFNGSIIAKSFSGSAEGHCVPFQNYIDP
jgi:choice-of-anchor A domain-containing protein